MPPSRNSKGVRRAIARGALARGVARAQGSGLLGSTLSLTGSSEMIHQLSDCQRGIRPAGGGANEHLSFGPRVFKINQLKTKSSGGFFRCGSGEHAYTETRLGHAANRVEASYLHSHPDGQSLIQGNCTEQAPRRCIVF